jgi:N-acetyl-gamma-glutamyl-phosphate reductase
VKRFAARWLRSVGRFVSERNQQRVDGTGAKRVLVAGASGFAGALAARLVWRHPQLELVAATAREDAGKRLDQLYPRHRVPIELTELDAASAGACDAAIVAYPHGAAAPVVAELRGRGVVVVDLSAEFRLSDLPTYEQWYGTHGAPELLEGAVYGLTELNREAIRSAELVANPGCYPTAAVLGLAPLARAGLIGDVVIDAKSGVSGAGRGGGEKHHFVSVDENFTPYGTEGHRHQPEIAQELGRISPEGSDDGPPLTFVPHLLPLDQGELVSAYVLPARELARAELERLYTEAYESEPFVEVVSSPPGVRDVRETNLCHIHVTVAKGSGRVVVFAAIDNLWKGAAGQAVQNLNLMLGLPEEAGLE